MDADSSRLERSSHTAFIHDNSLFVWGGYQVADGQDVVLPSDEIFLCDLYSGTWERREITGDIPPDLTGCCGSYANGTFYIFAGCDPVGYTNQMFSVDLTKPCYSWKKLTDTKGTTPSPRNKHSCWVHRDRLIYFGGYGCKTVVEVRNTSSSSFVVEEMSWTTIGGTLFRCWGWNNEVNVFDTHTNTWSVPETRGPAPAPRGCHAAAVLGNKGYISGGLENAEIDVYCLDLDTWTWTQFDISPSCSPLGRSMHTMTPVSDHTLFIYGGLGTNGKTLNDAWQFDALKKEWTEMTHPHTDKPRVCHTSCLGSDGDAVVFGGIDNFCILMDSMAVLRSPWQHHCSDLFVFQTQPYSLSRLCEDFIGRNAELFGNQLTWLPSKMQSRIEKRAAFFAATEPDLSD
ncbi:kelch domain-containing protein 1-like [Sphaeramia orbicularis]|uniref:Kelch domain-containing protein 1-like n=1 Tax=Sphaeramia orbicularis TaxID=375764 RepID=A0A673ABH4_9TELE|nr:kelch domain-containing protein 1-like [Sphaeramia orbicularis]XP_030019027.1 kelch domain-containing protein 1-like [Sphaeramia orbicularis]